MKKQKLNYVSPETETLVVRFEGALMSLSTSGNTIEDADLDEWGDEL